MFEQLYELAKRGNVISEQNVNYALALLQEHKGSEMVEMDKDVICHTIQGKPVKPKTLGQKDYVDNIRKNDCFRDGPCRNRKNISGHGHGDHCV